MYRKFEIEHETLCYMGTYRQFRIINLWNSANVCDKTECNDSYTTIFCQFSATVDIPGAHKQQEYSCLLPEGKVHYDFMTMFVEYNGFKSSYLTIYYYVK